MLLKSRIIPYITLILSSVLYGDSHGIQELSPKTMDKVLNSEKLVAVNFYAPWCGHCQNLAPEWEKVASSLDGIVTMASVNCDQEINNPLCKQHDIKGFPTIKIFHQSINKKGKSIKKSSEYKGPRDAKLLREYLLSRLPSHVRLIKGDATKVKSKSSISLDDFLETGNSTLTKVILFTHKISILPLYKALSLDFGNGRMLMGQVRGSEKKVMDALGIEKIPSLLVLTPGKENNNLLYNGKLKYRPLYDYLSSFTWESNKHNSSLEQQQVNSAPELHITSDDTKHSSPNHDEL